MGCTPVPKRNFFVKFENSPWPPHLNLGAIPNYETNAPSAAMYSVRQTTWDHIWSQITVEKSKEHATSMLMHATIKVFWGHIWKLAVEKLSNYHKSATLRSKDTNDWQKIFHMWNMWKCIHSSFKPEQAYRHHRGEKPLIGPNLCQLWLQFQLERHEMVHTGPTRGPIKNIVQVCLILFPV